MKYGSFNVISYSPLGHRCIHGQVHDVRHDPGRHQESQHLCQHDLHQFCVFENFTFGCSVEGVFLLKIELLDVKGFIFSRRSSVTNIDIKNANVLVANQKFIIIMLNFIIIITFLLSLFPYVLCPDLVLLASPGLAARR